MGIGSEFRKVGRKWEDYTRRSAKYTLATAGAIFGGPSGAKAGYEIGSSFDDRKPKLQQSGTDLAKLRREAQANGFNPLTVLRATGGQGFARDQIPMGRLSSDAFFNAFDAYQQRNPPAPEQQINDEIRLIDPTLSESIAVPKIQSKIMYRPSVLQEETVTSLLKGGTQITTDDKVKSIIGMTRDRFGKIHLHPWVEWEIDEMLTQLAGNAFFEATHWRDKALSAVKNHIAKAKTNKLSRKQIRDIVNSRKINKSYLHTPKLTAQTTPFIGLAEKALQ
tara:strand:+ start:78 stop:911 length:834 start_codon:yes stop_codon:yes gene_type:complete